MKRPTTSDVIETLEHNRIMSKAERGGLRDGGPWDSDDEASYAKLDAQWVEAIRRVERYPDLVKALRDDVLPFLVLGPYRDGLRESDRVRRVETLLAECTEAPDAD